MRIFTFINTICVISSGLIIDAFGELRDQLESVKEDMESNCFICGINKDYFDKVSISTTLGLYVIVELLSLGT